MSLRCTATWNIPGLQENAEDLLDRFNFLSWLVERYGCLGRYYKGRKFISPFLFLFPFPSFLPPPPPPPPPPFPHSLPFFLHEGNKSQMCCTDQGQEMPWVKAVSSFVSCTVVLDEHHLLGMLGRYEGWWRDFLALGK